MGTSLSGLLARLHVPAWLKSRATNAEDVIRGSGLFDTPWYLEAYPDVAARKVDPLRHYIRYGAREGRDPNRLFSSSWYLASNPDVAKAELNPLLHFILCGAKEGRSPGPLFDTKWYLDANPDVAAAGINPLLHFLRHGASEGRRPNSAIDSGTSFAPSAQIASPHSRSAQHKSFDHEAARTFAAAIRASNGHATLLRERPLISIVLPTRDRAELLPRAIESIKAQTYDQWELLIVDDGSIDATQSVVEAFLADPRIRLLQTSGRGVAAARNHAMSQAKGQFFAYLDSDNSWRPDFLEIAAAYLLERNLDLVYSALETNDGWHARYVGAEYEYTALSHRNFIDINVVLHRRDLYDRRGGCDEGLKRMSDWDLILRYAKDSRVAYVPFIGCVYDGRLTRSDRITVSEPVSWIYVVLGKHHLDWSRLQSGLGTRDQDLVSVVIPVHGQPELTAACLSSLFDTEAGCRFELVLVDNGSDSATATLLDQCVAAHSNARLVRNWENLNFALGCNFGFAATRGSIVVFLNNDTRVRPGWLRALVAPLAEPAVGAVQPKLLFPDGTIQTFGTVLGEQGSIPYELYRSLPGDAPHVNEPRTLDMISGACLAIRATDFAALHGFDPMFINGQEDSDLCLRLKTQLGKTCRVEPSSIVIHHEGGTPGRGRFAYSNRRTFAERWKSYLRPNDTEIYSHDGYRTQQYAPDVPEWAPAGLASYRPVLECIAEDGAAAALSVHAATAAQPSFTIKIACPSEAVRDEWGDYHFARSLAEALQRLGCRCRIDFHRSWNEPDTESEIDLVLRGLERFAPKPDRPSIMWAISHPVLVAPEEISAYGQVFVASDRLARQWTAESGIRVEPLMQCTDKNLFFPDPSDTPRSRDILFVGNSRNVFRPAVRAAIEAGLTPVVYGTRWEALIDARHIKGALIPNSMVADLYRKAGVVLNDHWPDMQRAAILSNRVFDVLACGVPIISDQIADLPAGFSEAIISFGPHQPIDRAIAQALNEGPAQRAARRTFAEIVHREHSFDRRAAVILESAMALLARREPTAASVS
ncbi:glycosyltransferase [Dongia deserti]|uniref:glycosyltransferase n=1 Tax=Dongia deserti TaxID=2268030 RepID=UPI0013C521F0|nr:glycosyltransferase [Dongia deserti]